MTDALLETACKSFIASAFVSMKEAHVLPVSRFNPYLDVGHDYPGDLVSGEHFAALERRLEELYPDRFGEPLTRDHAQFASHYVFSFLEAVILACSMHGEEFEATSEVVDYAIRNLGEAMESDDQSLSCCRVVSHIRTDTHETIKIGDFEVIPDRDGEYRHLHQQISMRVAGAGRAYRGDLPSAYDPPLALVCARQEISWDADPYVVVNELSTRIDDLLLALRLLYACTSQPYWQVAGHTRPISDVSPQLTTFTRSILNRSLLRRSTTLTADSSAEVASIRNMLERLEVKRDGMAATSVDAAIRRFTRSYDVSNSFDNIVDLMTALEGILLGADKDNDAILLRLKLRASVLLGDDQDSPATIAGDLGKLYELRSTIIHGGSLKHSRLRSLISGISTITNSDRFGIAVAEAVDRLRDITRRAILARLCLASGAEALWPMGSSASPDISLATESDRWRASWRDTLVESGIGQAGAPARPAVNFLSRDDR